MLRSALPCTVAVVLSLTLAACGAPRPAVGPPGDALTAGGLSLSADASSYTRGQPVHLTLRNSGSATYEGGVPACATTERWVHGAWTRAEDDQRACILMLATLAPGATLSAEVALDLPPGSYRLTHTMNTVGTNEPVTVATRVFRIGRR